MTEDKNKGPLVFPPDWADMDVVLCHDWLTGMRGGERVLEILCDGFPKARVVTLIHNRAAVSDTINSHKISTSWLQSVPGIFNNYRSLLPLFPAAIEGIRLPKADLVISSSHCVVKGVKPPDGARHLCYCFTPMRYAWTFYNEYFGHSTAKRMAARVLLPFLRRWDRRTAERVDLFVAISHHIQERIKTFYDRNSEMVYPPVDINRLTPGRPAETGRFDLVVSALVPYKRVDLAVSAYSRMGQKLLVVGTGSEMGALRSMAGPTVEFLGWQTDEKILGLYRSCRMLIFPGEEDFGIVPVEVQACGRPVIAYAKGGALETVKEGVSGVFFHEQTVEALMDAAQRGAAQSWDATAIRRNAEKFGPQTFVDGMARNIDKLLK